jgi:ATP-binding cassette subfamily B protein
LSESIHLLAVKLRSAAAQLRYLPRALGLVWAASRGWTAGWATLLAAQGVLPVAIVYLSRPLVDGIVAAVRAGGDWPSVYAVLILVALMAGVVLLAEILRSVTGWIRTSQSELVQDHINGLIHRKSVEADLAFYDSPDFYDHLHRARAEASYRPVALLESLGSLLQNGITLAAMLGVLVPFGWWLPVALVVSTLPALYVVLRASVRQHQWRLRTTADERRTWYYDWLLTTRETAAELRLFALGGQFQTAYRALRARLRKERVDLAREQGLAELGAGGIALLLSGGCLAWMAWRAVQGRASLGDLALFYQAFQQGLRLTRSLLENVGQLYYNSLFLGNLFEFLALEPEVKDPALPAPAPVGLRSGIRFRHVTFHYPGSQQFTLRNLNLMVPAGRIAALVGPNGAGKTTLLKLLCRFYDPDAGRIELDGADLRSFSIEDLRRLITVLFQEPVRYNATAWENVALGDAARSPDAEEIEAAARAAGAEEVIARLPRRYNTLLGKCFMDGDELSAGEWQRLALARAFVRPAPILILDEPTGAMDPWAETEWLDRLRPLVAGRTTLVITHRLTTAMRADVIYVMAEGRLEEWGSHQELLARGGLYARSWSAQASCA